MTNLTTRVNTRRKTDSGVLLAMAQHRRQRGRIYFGVLMGMESGEGQLLREGCQLHVLHADRPCDD